MNIFIGKGTHTTIRWAALLIALTVTAASLLQVANIKPTFADTGGYPWWNAPCAWNGNITGACSSYDWGELTCPSGDGYCNSSNQINSYYLYDQWGEGFRNCTSYAAWMLSTVNGFTIPFFDYAANWGTDAQNKGYTVNMTPAVGSIYWTTTPSPWGHVAWVQSVNSGGSSVTLEDYNHDTTGDYSGLYTVATNSASGYIHFKDYNSPPPPPPTVPTHRDLSWYDGTNLYGFQAYGYGTAATVSGYSQPYWAGAGQLSTAGSEGLFWYLNNGSGGTTGTIYWIPGGNFSSATAIRSGVGLPVWAGVGNFTGDGKRDSIAWYDGTTLWLFTGSGLSTTWSTAGYSTPAWAGVGDYNKDGKDDLFWYLSSSTTIYALTSTGSGFNGAASVRGPGIGAPVWAGVGDFHGDHYRDALAWYDGSALFTFEGSGLATTGTITGYSTPTWAGVGQWDSTSTKDGLFWYIGGTNKTLYGISSDGSQFMTSPPTLRSGIGAPTWADSGNFY